MFALLRSPHLPFWSSEPQTRVKSQHSQTGEVLGLAKGLEDYIQSYGIWLQYSGRKQGVDPEGPGLGRGSEYKVR